MNFFIPQDSLPKPSLFETSLLTHKLEPVQLHTSRVPSYVVSAAELEQIREAYNAKKRIEFNDFQEVCAKLGLNSPYLQHKLTQAFSDADYTSEGALDFDGFLIAYGLARSAKFAY